MFTFLHMEKSKQDPKSFLGLFFREAKSAENLWKAERRSRAMAYAGLGAIDWKRGLLNLKYRGLLEIKDGKYRLTEAGKKWFQKNASNYFLIRYPKWDKQWRVVIFDIPLKFYKESKRFTYRLKKLNFYMLQKSVFVSPCPCQELFDISKELRIDNYFDVIIAKNLGAREDEVREYFEL